MTTTDHAAAPARPDLDELIGRLDLAAKVRLLTGATMFTLPPEESIGLSELRLSDGPTGVRGLKFSGGRAVALFPNATLLSSAWSEEGAEEVGRILAEEALAQQIHVVLGPTINLHRTALGGRLFEAYSEDPLLSGRLAAAYVRGMQREGVAACLKHWVANESETNRNSMNSVVDETTLREVYLLPFEIAIDEARPWSVMAAYNDVNGVAATEHDALNNGVLKTEWGFDGVLMSDWFATKTTAPSANGGLDLVMPGPMGPWGEALVAAVRAGEVDEAVVDDHLRRVLRLADRVGVLGGERDYPQDLPTPDSAVRRDQLTRLAAAGMTVLTNRSTDAGPVLPLARNGSVALIGRPAIATTCMGGGSAQVNPPYQVSIAEGLGALLGDRLTVVDGVEVRVRPVPAVAGDVTDPVTGEPGVRATWIAADGTVLQERTLARAATAVGFDDDFALPATRIRFSARFAQAGPVEVGALGVATWAITAGGTTTQVSLAPIGSDVGTEILMPPFRVDRIEVAAGDVVEAEASRLDVGGTLLTPQGESGGLAGLFGLVARPAPRDADAVIAEAVAAAAGAEVAVVAVGLTEEAETEVVDKATLALPGRQDDLVRAVAAVARRTVVVVNAATPVLMPWIDDVDAVLWVGLPGQEAGHAVAAALLGDLEPTGRLVTSFPAADGAAPAWDVVPTDGSLAYTEGPFLGYRGHAAGRAPAPAFWFGHGLGYSTWEYADAALDLAGTSPAVSVRIRNTGTRSSREVLQVYLRPADVDQPVRLVGWAAAEVAPGADAEVRVVTDPRLYRRWDADAHAWTVLSGGGELLVARGLGDVRATLPLR